MGRRELPAVATQLIFLLAAVQTVPLPASTLDPQLQSNHNSRTPPATSWASGNNPTVTHDRPTSEYIEQQRQTVVYGEGPVWSSSPDIEEPFYPTTASSDHMSNRDLPTENIPITQKTISTPGLVSETYRSSSADKIHSEYGNPTEFSLQNYGQHTTKVEELIMKNADDIERSGKENVTQISINNAVIEQAVKNISNSNQEIQILEEPHALPLELSPNIVVPEKQLFTSPASNLLNNTPKNVDDSIHQKNLSSFSENHDHLSFIKNSASHTLNENVSNIDDDSLSQRRKLSQRLVIRDLSNASEPVVSSGVSSHGNNSTDLGKPPLLRPSIRASKAIGSFSHSSATDSSDLKKDRVIHLDRVGDDKSANNPGNEKENSTTSSNSMTSSNGTAPGINVNSSQKISQQVKEDSQASTLGNSFQNVTPNPLTVSTVGVRHKESSSPETSVPFDSSMAQRITTLSDTEEAANLTPLHNHEFFGRSASLSHDLETTIEPSPSVAPVSRSRIAASPPDIPHRGLDAASITGIALGIVVFAGLTGAVSFVLYRRRYLNKPQTLNDKCSNPDSSGYIDDSTLRENSEEMYSLDNDSFLNSLEAMTIQNYWTDNETCWRQSRP